MTLSAPPVSAEFSSPDPECDEEMRAALLRQATAKLAEARDCRAQAQSIDSREAASLLVLLAEELEARAQELAARAEK